MLKKIRESIERIAIGVTLIMLIFAIVSSIIIAIFSDNVNAINEITFIIGAPIILGDILIVFPITLILYLIEDSKETKNQGV